MRHFCPGARRGVPLLLAMLAVGPAGCNVVRQEHSATSVADTVAAGASDAAVEPRLSTGRGEDTTADPTTHLDKIGDFRCSLETQSANGVRVCGRFRCVKGQRPQTHWLDLTVQNIEGDQRTIKISSISLSGFPAQLAYTLGKESTLFGRGYYVQSLGAASWSIPRGTDRQCKLAVLVEHTVPGGPTYRDTFVWIVHVRGC